MALALAGFVATVIASVGEFGRGRQVRRFGRIQLPRVQANSAWCTLRADVTPDALVPLGTALAWRENARTEHASVAAFGRLSLELIALGAPPTLLRAAQEDALDEIRHAELCFSLAAAIDGATSGPAPFPVPARRGVFAPTRAGAFASLAVESLVDGAFHEGLSARVIAILARRCEVPTIRSVLKTLAADEGRHAAHGWDVVRWCLAEGGEAVAHALDGAVVALPETMTAVNRSTEARSGDWEAYGVPGHALESAEYIKCRADLVLRVTALVRAFRAERRAA